MFSLLAQMRGGRQFRESHHFEAGTIEFFPTFAPYLLPNNLKQDLHILRPDCVRGRRLIISLLTLLGRFGMSPFASQNPGGKEERRGSSAWEASGVQHLPFLDHWWENWAHHLTVAQCLCLKCSLQLSTDIVFILQFFLWRTPVNSHFPELKVRKRDCYSVYMH